MTVRVWKLDVVDKRALLSYGTTIYLIFLDIMKLPFETFCLEGNLINETLGFLWVQNQKWILGIQLQII